MSFRIGFSSSSGCRRTPTDYSLYSSKSWMVLVKDNDDEDPKYASHEPIISFLYMMINDICLKRVGVKDRIGMLGFIAVELV